MRALRFIPYVQDVDNNVMRSVFPSALYLVPCVQYNNVMRSVSPSGVVSTIAGIQSYSYQGNPNYPPAGSDGTAATSQSLRNPKGVCFDNSGNLLIADFFLYDIQRITPNGVMTIVAGQVNGQGFYGGCYLLLRETHERRVVKDNYVYNIN